MNERKDRIKVHIAGKEYYIVGGDFQGMLAAVKQVVGRRFASELKVWQLPGAAEEVQHQLEISGYALEGGKPVGDTPPPPPATTSAAGPGGDRIRIMVADQRLAVVGGAFQEMLEAVKGLPGRRFDSNTKLWQIPGEISIIKNLIEAAGFQLEGSENVSRGASSPLKTSTAPDWTPPQAPSSFDEPPDFFDEPQVEMEDMMPPDWWDDERLSPPLAPPDDWVREDYSEEPDPFNATPPAADLSPPATSPASGDRIRIRLGDIPLVVSGGSFQEMLAAVKNIPGRRFNGQDKIWEIPEDVPFDSINQALSAAGFMVMPG